MKTEFQSERAFTMLELLVSVAIIGIIASVAIGAYSEYTYLGYDGQAKNDLGNILIEEEAYYADNATYTTDMSILNGFNSTSGVICSLLTANDEQLTAECYHPKGTKTFYWDGQAPIRIEER